MNQWLSDILEMMKDSDFVEAAEEELEVFFDMLDNLGDS